MTFWEAILLGAVQGAFMFVPVSSTSHLVLTQHWLIGGGSALPSPASPEMVLFDLVVHVGTLVSIAVVMGASLSRLFAGVRADLRGVTRTPTHLRAVGLGFLSVAVTGGIGLAAREPLTTLFAQPLFLVGTLVVTGGLLWWTDHMGPGRLGLRDLGPLIAVAIGIAQGVALLPGMSRSGTTIFVALLLGLHRRWAAEYSFFIAIPTILAGTAVQAGELALAGEPIAISPAIYAIGAVVAALVGIAALRLVLSLLYRARFRVFAVYVWLLAGTVAIVGPSVLVS